MGIKLSVLGNLVRTAFIAALLVSPSYTHTVKAQAIQQSSPTLSDEWGPLAALAGKTIILPKSGETAEYRWIEDGKVLGTFNSRGGLVSKYLLRSDGLIVQYHIYDGEPPKLALYYKVHDPLSLKFSVDSTAVPVG